MENRNVATFIKVVELNNFTKAAQSLGYSQAAVTAQIKQLEKELEAPLFDRMGKKISLTSAGQTFLPYALAMLRAEEQAVASVKEETELNGTLRIGATNSLAMGALPKAAIDFIQEHPKVNIIIKVSDFIDDLQEKLGTGEIDIMFVMDDTAVRDDNVKVMEHNADIAFITHPDNILAGKSVSLKRVLEEPMVVTDMSMGYTKYLADEAAAEGLELKPVLELCSVAGIMDIIRNGYGTAYIPLFMAKKALDNNEVALVHVDYPKPKIKSRMYCHRNKWIDPMMQAFIDFSQPYVTPVDKYLEPDEVSEAE